MSRPALADSMSRQLERELGVSQRLLEAAKRVGVSPAQARDLAEWFASLNPEERMALVSAAATLKARRGT